ncbi:MULTISPECIES: hypothetical protein [Levilactobacillus]|uniref:hypothetical protein n=1 Tax=Levilactobacillus TaxID=2767886 RepID=UPI002165DA29|nr:hypothetical protein [Levilactobacillus brevis]MCT3565304.1 hypothetical protein [Levilactobacillus brevis]MCU0199884.1 hypothetical protein [Levilactobacillus brevis]UVW18079.1 hypothetical protein NX820_09205 [Levilactobacillus brevis]
MKPSDKINKVILEFLKSYNDEVNLVVFKKLFHAGASEGYSNSQIEKAFVAMDRENAGLLQPELMLDAQGNGTLNTSLADSWLSMKGEDYLDNLNHPKEEETLSQSFTINGNNISIGNNNQNSFSDNHSINVTAQIDKLLSYKSKLDPADQATLDQFAKEVQNTLASQDKPKQGALSKFGNFLDKTWNTISPVAAPLLVELAKRTLF